MTAPAPIPILLYHSIGHDAPEGLAPFVMDPDRFESHMRLLAERGQRGVTVSELCDRLDRGEAMASDTVLVTFDDGLADFDEFAWPVLRSHSIAATMYVVSDHIDGDAEWLGRFGPAPRMLSWEQLRRLDAEGCEIGAHSATHRELDTIPRPELVDEVRGARSTLAMGLGHPVRSFAYPHGYHDRAVKDAARRAGFDSACAVRNMLSSPSDDRFAMARITIDASWDAAQLASVLDGGENLRVAPRRQQLRTIGWRTYRRSRRRLGSRT
jgi:peptidoglycan/xylan/chitin deacetylase (PgdA/CDA1 family)